MDHGMVVHGFRGGHLPPALLRMTPRILPNLLVTPTTDDTCGGQHYYYYLQQQRNASPPSPKIALSMSRLLWLRHSSSTASRRKATANENDEHSDHNDNDDTNNEDNNDDDSTTIPSLTNPYADPNYPDLEFVNYDDPEYAADRSLDYNFRDNDTNNDASVLEQMREERRISNDEYQYQTYWHSVWNAGASTYRGEWTIYYSSTFFPQFDEDEEDDDDSDGTDHADWPRLVQMSDAPITVISRAVQGTTVHNNVNETYITHLEQLEQPMGDVDLAMAGGADAYEQSVVAQTYWPPQLTQADFRGHQGIMVCGKYVCVVFVVVVVWVVCCFLE
jgi:hypothetical protein